MCAYVWTRRAPATRSLPIPSLARTHSSHRRSLCVHRRYMHPRRRGLFFRLSEPRERRDCTIRPRTEGCMNVGTVKERKDGEARVGLTPEGAFALVAHGHSVFFEVGCGVQSGHSDTAY